MTPSVRPLSRRSLAAAVMAAASLGACSTNHGPEPVGSYVDDASITSTVKTRFVEDKTVDPQTIQVETKNATVVLSGTARSSLEKTNAESLAMKVKGVKLVRNEILVKP